MRQFLNWKTYLVVIALAIVSATLFYTNRLAKKLALEERKNVEQLVEGLKLQTLTTDPIAMKYASIIVEQNKTIPLILTDESNSILGTTNIDSSAFIKGDTNFFKKELSAFRNFQQPIVFDFGTGKNYVYYGESYILKQLRYFPYVQLAIIILFLVVVLIALSAAHRSLQNQVWVGLSKETAHQLGTPLSSIEAWLELLKDNDTNNEAVIEMSKDMERLKLVADRFSKVGSAPKLEEEDLITRVKNMVEYMQKRAPSKVSISMQANEEVMPAYISGPLFDWVLENLMRNALDAMDGKGKIDLILTDQSHQVVIDVKDTGKGIPKHQVKKIFNPGFTTKKRGWGLGLSLSKRIIEKYHHGSLLVKHSEVGKGTHFRMILRR